MLLDLLSECRRSTLFQTLKIFFFLLVCLPKSLLVCRPVGLVCLSVCLIACLSVSLLVCLSRSILCACLLACLFLSFGAVVPVCMHACSVVCLSAKLIDVLVYPELCWLGTFTPLWCQCQQPATVFRRFIKSFYLTVWSLPLTMQIISSLVTIIA